MTKDYLIVPKPKAGRFYLLPKIHKDGIPGRPIVSANGHPTERISEFVDHHLRPFVCALPSHLQDTTDYLRRLESQKDLPDQTLLVSMDVTALYTNIPHGDDIAACKEAWDSLIIKNPPTETLIELLVLILKCNNFVFCDKHFLQVQGTAMGNKMAPSYANVFMGKLEGQLLAAVPLKPFKSRVMECLLLPKRSKERTVKLEVLANEGNEVLTRSKDGFLEVGRRENNERDFKA
ncbi:uncharacterized protein LOC132721799 [Ruditapes philippinarum]|uniref:uncharacterized protein LOC132721799 n=1 Tax=Ruditapes philippinarum TaxID=129788 RepID=UPI00295B1B17|nr:uncharacterized protein LOC132721799 [Ruditapes philippinarum]